MKTTEVTEMCPHCQNEVTVQWNAEKDGYEFVGINFGDDVDTYYDVLMHSKDLEKEHFQVHMTSRNQPEIIITHENVELTNTGESSTDDEKTD